MPDPIKTPLFGLHKALKAKMVTFAGYAMPLQYPMGIIKEHLHCRSRVGLFDISHMGQCCLTGHKVLEQMDRLVPSNLLNLASGRQRYTVLTRENGGVIDDIIILRQQNSLKIIVNAACKKKAIAHFQQHLHADVEDLSDQALLAIQGPEAKTVLSQLAPETGSLTFMQAINTRIRGIECTVCRCGYTGEDGFEISLAARHARSLANILLDFPQVEAVGLGARDTLRLEAGLCLYGHELSPAITPVEAGLAWLIDPKKIDYPGAPVIRHQLKYGADRKRIGLSIDSKTPLRAQMAILDQNNKPVGIITSGSFSPSLKKPIAFGLVEREHAENALYTVIRSNKITLLPTPLPFVPHRYHKA